MALHASARERGAAAVEMALLLPLLLLVVGGVVDLSRFMFTKSILTNAAREGARMVAVGYTQADATARVGQAAAGVTIQTPPGYSFSTPTWTACPASPGPTDAVTVTVSTLPATDSNRFKFIIITPMSRFFTAGAVGWDAPVLSGTASMRCGG